MSNILVWKKSGFADIFSLLCQKETVKGLIDPNRNSPMDIFNNYFSLLDCLTVISSIGIILIDLSPANQHY